MADSNGKVSAEKVQKNPEPSKIAKEKITQLNLDNCRKDNIFETVEQHPNLEMLSLINTGLSSLKGFPKLANLKKLHLSDNRISDGLNYLNNSPKIQNLDLSGNKIKAFEVLEALQEFKQLTVLDLFNNEVTQVENYREKLFKMLPSLQYLDGLDAKNETAPSDDEEDDDELNGNDSDDDDSDDLDDYGEDDDDSVEEEDMSLAEIYNEDLEEDNSDWEEGGDDDDDDDEIESDEDEEANKSSTTSAAAAKGVEKKAEADEPTNKKRKTNE